MKKILNLYEKSNFNFLRGIEDKISDPELRHKFLALKSLCRSIEDETWRRDFHSFRIYARYLLESIVIFSFSQAEHLSCQGGIMSDSYNQLITLLKSNAANKVSEGNTKKVDSLDKRNFSISGLFYNIKKIWPTLAFAKKVDDDVKNIHSKLHLGAGNNINDKLGGQLISGLYVMDDLELKEAIGIIEFFFHFIKMLMIDVFKLTFVDGNLSFDSDVYEEGRLSLESFQGRTELLSLIGMDCLICKNGRLNYPKENHPERNFRFGPVLICDNDSCKARMSNKLKLRDQNKYENCDKCEYGRIKRTVSYVDFNSTKFNPEVKENCNKCFVPKD